MTQSNESSKQTEQKKDIKSCKRKDPVTYKGRSLKQHNAIHENSKF